MWTLRYGLMLLMSLMTEKTYDGALLMLKLLREVSPLTSSKLYTVSQCQSTLGPDSLRRGHVPEAEKSEAPRGTRR